MKRTVSAEFWLEDIVFLKNRDEKRPGIITGVRFRPREDGQDAPAYYSVTWPDGVEGDHYACELTREFIPCYDSDAS